MGMGMSRFPDPYESRDDLSHVTVFLVVLLLLVSVGAILFFGNAWLFAPVKVPAFLQSAPAAAAPASSATTPVPPPTFAPPTPVPPLAGVPYRPTPNGTPTATPTPKAATPTPKAKSPTPSAKTSKPSAKTATPAAATPTTASTTTASTTPTHPTPPATIAHVGNTGGDGAYLRHTPHLSDTWVAWRDGTKLVLTGAEADGDGQHWLQVRDPRGDVGWMPAQYVVR